MEDLMQFVQLLLGKIQKIGADQTASQEKHNTKGHIPFNLETDRRHHGERKQCAQPDAEKTGCHGNFPQQTQAQQQGNGQKKSQSAGQPQKRGPEDRYGNAEKCGDRVNVSDGAEK